MSLTTREQERLNHLEAAFEHNGGRGVIDAEEIDHLRRKRDWVTKDEPTPKGKVKVHIDGAYVDGHEYERWVLLDEPLGDDEDLEDLWEEAFNNTGDAHFEDDGSSIDDYCEATIVEAPGRPYLVGRETSWAG